MARTSPRLFGVSAAVGREPGLELRIYPDGRRVFALRRGVAGKDVRLTLGEYGTAPKLTLEDARARAATLKAKIHAEGDFRERERRARADDSTDQGFL